MKLTPEGKKVWDAPYHPVAAKDAPAGQWSYSAPGVSFGWVVAKDVLAALKTDVHDCNASELAHDAIYQAIALCNALGEQCEK